MIGHGVEVNGGYNFLPIFNLLHGLRATSIALGCGRQAPSTTRLLLLMIATQLLALMVAVQGATTPRFLPQVERLSIVHEVVH